MQALILMGLALALPIHANVGELSTVRPAEAACNEYQNLFQKEDGKTVEHVFNGGKAKLGEFPFTVSLKSVIDDNVKHVCSGSLITNRHVLTAAHCIKNIQMVEPIQVLLGAVALNDASNNVQVRSIGKMTPHPKYRLQHVYYDVAIIELSTPVNITKYVQPICLHYKPLLSLTETTNTSRLVAGWVRLGSEIDDEDRNNMFKTHSLKLVEKSVCNNDFKDFEHKLPHGIDDSMICMLHESNDYCVGAGAPLLQKNNNSASLIGVSSFGLDGYCLDRQRNVYSSIYYYLDWIEEVVWPEKKQVPI